MQTRNRGLTNFGTSFNGGPSCQTSYSGGNRFVASERSQRPGGLIHRYGPRISWLCTSSQGLDCSSIKILHELSSVRREAGRYYLLEVLVSEGKLPSIREEQGIGASSVPVVIALPGSHAPNG